MRVASDYYLEKARRLTPDEAEQVLGRIKRKWTRRVEDRTVSALEAIAIQLEKDDSDLNEWRGRWAEIKAREESRAQ